VPVTDLDGDAVKMRNPCHLAAMQHLERNASEERTLQCYVLKRVKNQHASDIWVVTS